MTLRTPHFKDTARRFVAPVLLLVCLGLTFSGCTGTPKHPTWKNAAGAEQYERLMWETIQQRNWAEAGRHLASTFVGVAPDGQIFDRIGWIQRWKTSPQIKSYSLDELTVQPNGPDMVVTYIVKLEPAAGPPGPPLRVVSVWQEVKRGWIQISTSATPIS